MKSATLAVVRNLVAAGKVRISQHGMFEPTEDSIAVSITVSGLAAAVVVEDYPEYAKGACVLCLQRDALGEPIHILWGLAAQNPEMEDYRTRRPV